MLSNEPFVWCIIYCKFPPGRVNKGAFQQHLREPNFIQYCKFRSSQIYELVNVFDRFDAC